MLNGFKYWEAPESEVAGLFPGVRSCDLCGQESRCFDLARAIQPTGASASAGCTACLRLGRFGFFHITTMGYLDEQGLTWYGDDEPEEETREFVVDASGTATSTVVERLISPRTEVPQEAVEELRRTPDFPTWNEVSWPLHCSDFMIYLGTWQPRDVRRAAAERHRSPSEVFAEMVEAGEERLWLENEDEWSITFHAFRCVTCRALKGAVDLD